MFRWPSWIHNALIQFIKFIDTLRNIMVVVCVCVSLWCQRTRSWCSRTFLCKHKILYEWFAVCVETIREWAKLAKVLIHEWRTVRNLFEKRSRIWLVHEHSSHEWPTVRGAYKQRPWLCERERERARAQTFNNHRVVLCAGYWSNVQWCDDAHNHNAHADHIYNSTDPQNKLVSGLDVWCTFYN